MYITSECAAPAWQWRRKNLGLQDPLSAVRETTLNPAASKWRTTFQAKGNKLTAVRSAVGYCAHGNLHEINNPLIINTSMCLQWVT